MAENQTTPNAGAAAADATTPAATAQKPEGVPDKFWDAAESKVDVGAMAKSYVELEKKQSATPAQTTSDALAIPVDAPLGEDAGVDELARSAGLDPEQLGRQFAEKGKLTAAQYKALRGKPITREMINDHLEMRTERYQAAKAKLEEEATKLAGGEKQLNIVLDWAKNGLSAEERNFYDKQTGHSDTAIPGVEWLLGKYNQAVGAGKAQALIEGEGALAASGGYKTRDELFKALGDSRYQTDKQYKQTVDNRRDATPYNVAMGLPAS